VKASRSIADRAVCSQTALMAKLREVIWSRSPNVFDVHDVAWELSELRRGCDYLPLSITGAEAQVRVQRVVMPGSGLESWTVIGDDHVPVEPVERFLAYLTSVECSPKHRSWGNCPYRTYRYHHSQSASQREGSLHRFGWRHPRWDALDRMSVLVRIWLLCCGLRNVLWLR